MNVFDKYSREYDEWFEKNKPAYISELRALKKLIPKNKTGLEVGAGTGRFSVPFGIKTGVEPSKAMAKIARGRGLNIYNAKAEKLPFENESFDFVLMVTVLCFVKYPLRALKEARRVLKPGGRLIIGMLNKKGPAGGRFYKHARFYSVKQLLTWLKISGFRRRGIFQTIFKPLNDIKKPEPVKTGYSKGLFVAVSAQKE